MIYINQSITRYTLPPGVYEISDSNLTFQSLLQDDVKVNITLDDIGIRSNLSNIETVRFTKKTFSCTFSGFTQKQSGPLSDIETFVQLTPGTHKSDKPVVITDVDEIHLEADCINGSTVNCVREPILYRFALDKPTGHKIYKEPRNNFSKRLNKSVLSHITFYLEGDDHKPVDYNGETINFTCQLIKSKWKKELEYDLT